MWYLSPHQFKTSPLGLRMVIGAEGLVWGVGGHLWLCVLDLLNRETLPPAGRGKVVFLPALVQNIAGFF